MNKTERKARKWLSGAKGFSEDEILFYPNRTPDFILPDGSKYEVKLLYKDKIILFPSQLRALEEQTDTLVAVFSRDGLEPMAIIPADELLSAVSDGTKRWQNIKLVVYGEGKRKTVMYLPEEVQEALEKYIAEKYSSESRMVTATISRALSEFLEKEGYLGRQGGGT